MNILLLLGLILLVAPIFSAALLSLAENTILYILVDLAEKKKRKECEDFRRRFPSLHFEENEEKMEEMEEKRKDDE